jgi:hypothetical protein
MGSATPPPRRRDHDEAARDDGDADLKSLQQENSRLRELVVQLSGLVIRTIVDRK